MKDVVLNFFAGDFIESIQSFTQFKGGEFQRVAGVKAIFRCHEVGERFFQG